MDFRVLIRKAGLEDLLPSEYSRFGHTIIEGLSQFLSFLPADVQDEIVREQLRLGRGTTVAHRLRCLAAKSPVLHKFAQIIARNQTIPLDLRLELQTLEWLEPSVPREFIKEELERELGPLDSLGISLAPQPIAEASVAVVIPFATRDSNARAKSSRFDGIFKILKPGIEKRLRLELEMLARVGAFLDGLTSRDGVHELDYRKLFSQITESLQKEIQLDKEQQHLRQAAKSYSHLAGIKIPGLLPYCSPRVTAMERIHGHKLDAATIQSPALRQQLAELVVKALIVYPLLSSSAPTLFHADPHAGNLYVTEAGHIAVLDWSQADFLQQSQQVAITRIILSAVNCRQDRIVSLLADLASNSSYSESALKQVIDSALLSVRSGRLPDCSWLTNLFDKAALDAGVQFPPNVLLFRKALLTITGIVEELAGSRNFLDAIVFREAFQVFAAEFPARWQLFPPYSEWSTHLSNADLVDAALDSVALSHDYWLKFWCRVFGAHC